MKVDLSQEFEGFDTVPFGTEFRQQDHALDLMVMAVVQSLYPSMLEWVDANPVTAGVFESFDPQILESILAGRIISRLYERERLRSEARLVAQHLSHLTRMT